MNIVNGGIQLNFSEVNIQKSYGNYASQADIIKLSYFLSAKDCIFELESKNYTIEIEISKKYLAKYQFDHNFNYSNAYLSCATQECLFDLLQSTEGDIGKEIFIESRVLVLLYLAHKGITSGRSSCEGCALLRKQTEYQTIKRAKDYILNNLSNAITIPIIAQVVGTNQSYLKKSFKEVYHQTIFECIQEHRMHKAKYLLKTSQLSISDVAIAVGYASISSFSQAFKSFFGYSPTKILNENISDY